MSELLSGVVFDRKPVRDLVPADYNPRKALKAGDPEYEKLRRSIETFGLVEPLIWNKRSGTLVGGHQRLTVLMDMGVNEVDVSVVDLDDEHEKALNVALNKIEGAWDNEKLAALLSSLDAPMQELSGFGEAEIDELLGVKGAAKKPDAIKAPPVSRLGDLWLLGEHRLLCGDSCSEADVGTLMDGEKARLVVTDPPYNVDYSGKIQSKAGKYGAVFLNASRENSQILNDAMPAAEFASFLDRAFKQIHDAMLPGGVIYMFHSDTHGNVFRNSFVNAGFYLSQGLVWVKSSIMMGRNDYHWKHEPILYGWRDDGPHKWYGRRKKPTVIDEGACVSVQPMEDGTVFTFSDGFNHFVMRARDFEIIDDGHDNTMSVIYYEKQLANDLHPTMKPVGLLEKLIRNSSQPGDIVLDTFGGSGSTLIAAGRQRRRCFMMELDPKYCDVIVSRFVDTTAETDVWLVRDGERIPYAKALSLVR